MVKYSICNCDLQRVAESACRIKDYCPNYFIPKANLLHKHSVSKIVETSEKRLNEFCNSGLFCNWFVEKYILSFIRRHFKPRGARKTMPHFVCYMPHLFETWRVRELNSLNGYFSSTLILCCWSSRPVVKRVEFRTAQKLQNHTHV